MNSEPNYKSFKVEVGGDHYKSLAIQPTEYIHRNGLGFCEGNVVKYVTRHDQKDGKRDLEKAIHYIQMLIDMEYPECPEIPAPLDAQPQP